MKTQKLTFVLLAFLGLQMSSCTQFDFDNDCIKGEGALVEREIDLENFSSLNLASSFKVVIAQGETQKIVAVGQQNIIDSINTNVNDQQWTACLKPGCYSTFDLTIYVTVPAMDQIEITGSGNVELLDFSQENDLYVTIAGSGNFTMNDFQSADNLNVTIVASGNFYADQNISCFKNLQVSCSGSGNFHGYSIFTETCKASTLGSGNCFVSVSEKLDASIAGSGDIRYKGQPEITSSINGSGKLIAAN
ncbi:MAG: DUF2807 domain-containing protein [Prolixibacteraceae bacterium]|nr:DUF2807 domain-containing protein [Prolixibacteraceae bacterium]